MMSTYPFVFLSAAFAILTANHRVTFAQIPCVVANPCRNNTYCSEKPDGTPLCIDCDVACELGCDAPGPERCTSCKTGYYKPTGLQQPCTECIVGFFGQNCLKQCHCLNNELCNKTDGIYNCWKCDRGYTGLPYCQDICPVNTFGLDCGFQCHCPVNDNCSHIQGDCSSGRCDPDWDGPGCQRRLPKLVLPPRLVSVSCNNITLTWDAFNQKNDIGSGPVGQYNVFYKLNHTASPNVTVSWISSVNVTAVDGRKSYIVSLTSGLSQDVEYNFRVDTVGMENNKLLKRFSSGTVSGAILNKCTKVTETSPTEVIAPVPLLSCGQGQMKAQFFRCSDRNLEEKHLSVLNQSNCTDVTKSTTSDYVTITIPVDKCGTTISRNGTHIIYFNELKYDFTSQEGLITRVNVYRIDITCALPVTESVTQRVQSVTELVTQRAAGRFTASMEIYRNDTSSSPVTDNPVAVPLGEWLNMAVLMEQYDPRLMLTVTDCLATPTGNKSGSVRQILFANKCSQESTLFFYPINNFKFGFRFKPFRFVGYDLLYLHCDAIVCIAADNIKECDRTCNNTKPNATSTIGRRRRSNNNIFYTYADSQAIVLYVKEPTQTDSDTKDRIVIDSGSNEIPTTTTVHNSLQNQIHGKQLSLLSENSSGHRIKFPFLQAALISLFLLAFNIF